MLFEPMDSYIKSVLAQKGQPNELTSSVIVAKACLDPKAAVELLESLPVDQQQFLTSNEARMNLASVFSASPGERWKRLWRSTSAQLPLEE